MGRKQPKTATGQKHTKNHRKTHEDQTLPYEILVFGTAVEYPGSHIGRYRKLRCRYRV